MAELRQHYASPGRVVTGLIAAGVLGAVARMTWAITAAMASRGAAGPIMMRPWRCFGGLGRYLASRSSRMTAQPFIAFLAGSVSSAPPARWTVSIDRSCRLSSHMNVRTWLDGTISS